MTRRQCVEALTCKLPAIGLHNQANGQGIFNFIRSVSTRVNGNELLKELKDTQDPPKIIPYQISSDEAIAAFNQWHSNKLLSPGALLSRAITPIRQAALPFWLFDADVQVQYRGSIGVKSGTSEAQWEDASWAERGIQTYPWSSAAMQVYASYTYRRDLVEAVKTFGRLENSSFLTKEQAIAKEADIGKLGELVALDSPDVKRPIAWDFALLNVRKLEEAAARSLLSRGNEFHVRDVEVRLKTIRRRARLIFYPAFILNYNFGEHFNVHGVRRPEAFQAFVGGLADPAVAAERHFSPTKVQVAAAASMGSLAGLTAALGLQGQTLLSPTSLLTMLLVCTSIGLAARLSPILLRQHQEDQRILVEEEDMEKILSQGMGPSDIMDEKHEAIRTVSEWRRWEEANKWAWEGSKRRRWAELLWRRQQLRRIQKRTFQEMRARAEARLKYEQDQEAKRRARWGYREQNFFADTESGGARKDFMGYYTLLGLDAGLGRTFSQPDIKKAFREAAQRWHPDKLHVADESDRAKAHTQFAKVRKAYEILRSPEKRRQYDSGIDPAS